MASLQENEVEICFLGPLKIFYSFHVLLDSNVIKNVSLLLCILERRYP